MNHAHEAKILLRHYLGTLSEWRIDPQEIDTLVDHMIAAAVETAEARLRVAAVLKTPTPNPAPLTTDHGPLTKDQS